MAVGPQPVKRWAATPAHCAPAPALYLLAMFKSILQFRLSRIWGEIWSRITTTSVGALILVLLTPLVAPLVPDGLVGRIDEESLMTVLSIITNSMLIVATFSLSAMVSAHLFAAGNITPRAHRMLRADGLIHSVLATYIGSFVFALTAIFVIKAQFFGPSEFVVLYLICGLVIAAVVAATIRWVYRLSALGTVDTTTEAIEKVTVTAMRERMERPFMGGLKRPPGAKADTTRSMIAEGNLYCQYVDMPGLNEIAEEIDTTITLFVVPGQWTMIGDPLVQFDGPLPSDDVIDRVRKAVICAEKRTYRHDPLFGIEVLTEAAQRALSPAVNDPATAVSVLRKQTRILAEWREEIVMDDPPHPRVRVPALSPDSLLKVAFDRIARDGAAFYEVQHPLQKTLAWLARNDAEEMRTAATEASQRALSWSDRGLTLEAERDALRTEAVAA